MLRRVLGPMLMLLSAPAIAQGDELDPVPAQALMAHPYFAEGTPAQMLFINVRARPVRVLWVAFDGSQQQYAELKQGEQWLQPTFVAHRWLVEDVDGTPLEGFIATRAAARSNGTPQIAIIR